jgi:GntR family transcriptional repressor for pyruvate dehydrogenase complex/GntR family transcriptional activator of glc operon
MKEMEKEGDELLRIPAPEDLADLLNDSGSP